jgi:hypothetical protein
MKVCKHAQKFTQYQGYHPIDARKPNPIAQGNITETETCLKCGAVRETNRNAGQSETTGWTSRTEVAEIVYDLNRRGMYTDYKRGGMK